MRIRIPYISKQEYTMPYLNLDDKAQLDTMVREQEGEAQG